mmetsp:Transcript_3599/g.4753  ORF Transcript_3599/g.4753 Transcript_3599/m.4753 type:complete len:165 (-) Transcript_3599:198-692(-)
MQTIKLLGDKTPDELWTLTTNVTVPGLLLLMFLPRWKYTKTITLIGPLLAALIYTLGAISAIFYPQTDPDPNGSFTSLKGVMTLFQDEVGVYIGWMHYIVFDGLVARWIILDSVETKQVSYIVHGMVMVPILFLTIMLGPMGWLIYIAVRNFLPANGTTKSKSS